MVGEIYGGIGWGGNDRVLVVVAGRANLSGRLFNYLTQRRQDAENAENAENIMELMDERRLNEISGETVDSAIHVHGVLGPGLLESAYEACLACELRERGLAVRTQVAVPIVYKSVRLDQGYRIDILVEEALVVEIKTIVRFHPVHEAQLLTHLRLSGFRLGLLLNFFVPLMRDGIKRVVNGL